MATTNSTTTPSIADSSLPAGTNTTTTSSTVSTTSTTSSHTSSSTDAGRPSEAWTTSTLTFVTAIHSTPTTSTVTTIVQISAARPSGSPSFRPPSAVGLSTRPTTSVTVTEEVAGAASTSSTASGESKSQPRPSVAVLVVIGLVVASFIAGIFLLICRRRRRRRRRRKEVEYIFKRPESSPSFLDADPFVSVPQNLAAMRSAEDGVQRKITHPVRWSAAGKGTLVFDPHPRKPRVLDNDSGVILSNQHGTQRSSPCLPATYPSTFWEQDEIIGGEGQLLERDATEPTPIPVSYHHPPPRPPRSPRRKSTRLARPSLDSVSTTHSSSASLLYRLSLENRLEDLPYHGTIPLVVQKKSTPL